MKKIMLLLTLVLGGTLIARPQEEGQVKFKPRYAGTSLDAGMMFTSGFGSAYYVAPKINFQMTPRLFVNTGVSVMQYNLLPGQSENQKARTATGVYVFAEGQYLLNEKWSINGSVMKEVGSGPVRQVSPYRVPSEAMHIGVDYKITPNITVGARIGYSNGYSNGYHSMHGPMSSF